MTFIVPKPSVPRHVLTGPPDDTILAYKSLQMSTPHFIRKEMPWIPLAPLPVNLAGATLPRNGHVRRGSVDATVWQNVEYFLSWSNIFRTFDDFRCGVRDTLVDHAMQLVVAITDVKLTGTATSMTFSACAEMLRSRVP